MVEFDNLDMNMKQYKDMIFEAYSQLRDGGGFVFLKCTSNTRKLEVLSQVILSSPRMLEEHVGTARMYIKPLQHDLDLSQIFELPKGVHDKIILATVYLCLIVFY